jgi:type VI secretion system protein ImpK
MGRYAAAEELVRPLVDSAEIRVAALDLLARIFAQQGRLSEAQDCWGLALEADPSNERARAGTHRIKSIQTRRWRPIPYGPAIIVLVSLGLVLLGGFYIRQYLNSLHQSIQNEVAKVVQRESDGPLVKVPSTSGPRPEPGVGENQTVGALADSLDKAGMIVKKEGKDIIAVFNSGLFLSGANLSPWGENQLSELGRLLKPLARILRVQLAGCTDDIPVRAGSIYANNIALSYARAVSVAEYLRRDPGLPASMFILLSPEGAVPPFPNDSQADRLKNRTVILRISSIEPTA